MRTPPSLPPEQPLLPLAAPVGGRGGAAQLRSDVAAVHGNERAFCAVKRDGSVVAWGAADSGGDCSGVAAPRRCAMLVRGFGQPLRWQRAFEKWLKQRVGGLGQLGAAT